MERYSLYIDHMLVSGLIRQLENIVKTCSQELDQAYQTYELRTSIYEEFVFQITAMFNSKYGLKIEDTDIKNDELKKFYELTTKLEGINASAKLEDIFVNENKIKKGRPSKNIKAEETLVEWINHKHKQQGITKFLKRDLDDIYIPLTSQAQKKVIPVNTYLKIFKKYDLHQITILARGGKEKTLKDLTERKDAKSFWKKEQEDQSTLKYQHVLQQSQLDSTSELQSDFDFSKEAHMVTRLSQNHDVSINRQKRKLRSSFVQKEMKKEMKLNKQNQKKKTFKNIFDDDSDHEVNQSEWDMNLSVSNDFLDNVDHENNQIYENSKSFE